MCFVESPVVVDSLEKPERRGGRVLTARLAARREKVLAQLLNPIIVAEDPERLTDQAKDIYEAFKPRNGWQDWLTSEIAVIMVRINRCSRIERKLRDLASYRAIDFWEDDQKVEVETLALKIDGDPARVVAKLRQTPIGCDWLIARWRILARVDPSQWTDEQRTLATRLIGHDSEINPRVPGFAAQQIAELTELRHRVEEADAIVRGLVEADLSDDRVPNLGRLRRYSRSLHRQMKWYIDQFHVEHPDRWDDPGRKPAFHATEVETRDTARKPRWSYAEPKPADDETKPTLADSDHEYDKTKPFEPTPRLAAAMSQTVVAESVIIQDCDIEPGSGSNRKHRVNPVRDAANREKAKRRRLSLACVSSS